ncbi:MAG: AAA family ATPase, partial [Phaeodactylibacter sp.]|nr:AAA family ATPase [Phaeodactylibacter sp.]
MLIEFNLGNFWSFKEVQSLQMQAAKIRSKYPRVDDNNVAGIDGQLSLLKSKAIYGANGSGKSNLVRGMHSMLAIIQDSLKDEQVLSKKIAPFQLNEEAVSQPSFFQVSFLLNGHIFRYGFEAGKERIASEWLFGKPLNANGKAYRERYFFTREGMGIQANESQFKEGSRFARVDENNLPLYRENALFLTVLAAFNGPLSRSIARYLGENLVVVPAFSDPLLRDQSLSRMKEKGFRQKLTSLLKGVDPTIEKLEMVEPEYGGMPAGSETPTGNAKGKAGDVAIYRYQYSKEGKRGRLAPLLLSSQEAEGTKKLFYFSALIFDVLDKGKTAFID